MSKRTYSKEDDQMILEYVNSDDSNKYNNKQEAYKALGKKLKRTTAAIATRYRTLNRTDGVVEEAKPVPISKVTDGKIIRLIGGLKESEKEQVLQFIIGLF